MARLLIVVVSNCVSILKFGSKLFPKFETSNSCCVERCSILLDFETSSCGPLSVPGTPVAFQLPAHLAHVTHVRSPVGAAHGAHAIHMPLHASFVGIGCQKFLPEFFQRWVSGPFRKLGEPILLASCLGSPCFTNTSTSS